MNFRKRAVARAVQAAVAGSFALAGGTAVSVAASEAGVDPLEEVVVTGSRIKRKDFTSNAPVSTVDFQQLDITGTINTESLLNTLPQMVPGFDRTSNNPGNGTATVDLRGLGANRTLVLINSTRAVPTTQGGTVDINNIPTALIDQIEVLTGGASAVYGSDAVTGVVNFLMKDDFEGISIAGGYEQTEQGDAAIASVDVTFGVNTGDGKGNIALNVMYTDREDLFQGDRGFATFAQFEDEDDEGQPFLFNGGSSGIPQTNIRNPGFSGDDYPSGIVFEQDGSARAFRSSGENNDFYNYAPVNYIQVPQTRYQASAFARYEIADFAEAYGRFMYTSSKVPQQLAPTPIFQTVSFTLDGNPFLTPDAQRIISDAIGVEDANNQLIDSDGDGIADTARALIRRRLLEVGPRVSSDNFSSYQIQLGLRGDIGDSSWSYDAYYQTGTVENSSVQLGNVNRDRFQQALLLDLAADPTGGTCMDTSANGSTISCAPINIFGEGNISSDGAAFLRTSVAAAAFYEQSVASVVFTGDLFALPGGTASMAAGAEYLENSADFQPSQDLAAGTIAGFNGSPASKGSYDATSAYVEAYLPILADQPWAHVLDLELAYRATDYSTVGKVDSYKISGSWAPVPDVRIRGGINTAVRAPSIGDLFAPAGEDFPSATDPCAAEGNPTAAVTPICIATGVSAAAVGSASLNLAAGQVRALSGGNPNLQEESAETLTFGVVVEPAAVSGLRISVDYFDIEIDDFIFDFGGGANNILNVCYDPNNPQGGIGSVYCNNVIRREDGSIMAVNTNLQNAALQTLQGFDLQVVYAMDLLGGVFDINYIGTLTTEHEFEPAPGLDIIACDGRFGVDCGEPVPEYKHRATFSWALGNWTAQVLWRHVGESSDDDPDKRFAVETLDAEDYFDLAGSYKFAKHYTLTFGLDNALDTDPPILGDNQEQANTYPATYDVFGRTWYVKMRAEF